MKKRILVVMVAFAAGLISTSVMAQDKLKLELGYNLSAPLGSFKKDYISNTSFRGITGEVSYAVSSKFSLGLNLAYQSYYQKYGRDLYKTGPTETTSAVVTNTIELMPVLVKGTFLPLGGSSTIQPYLSAGAGLNMVTYSQYLGEFTDAQSSSPFVAQAGAGVLIPFGNKINQSGIKLGATYNYSPYNKNGLTNLNSVGANAGVVFALK